jgi:hypothetical protein
VKFSKRETPTVRRQHSRWGSNKKTAVASNAQRLIVNLPIFMPHPMPDRARFEGKSHLHAA